MRGQRCHFRDRRILCDTGDRRDYKNQEREREKDREDGLEREGGGRKSRYKIEKKSHHQ